MGLILLVRHGQASWGAADYDVLSATGHAQAAAVGRWLAGQGVRPTCLLRGRMRRHDETMRGLCAAAGWSDAAVEEDAGWDEFDHVPMMAAYLATRPRREEDPRDLDALFESAVAWWVAGDGSGGETFPAFGDRVDRALARTVDAVASGGTAVVVTSGGPISWAATQLLGAGQAGWRRVNRVTVNGSVSRVTVGERGATTLVSYNEHAQLPSDLVTYR